MNMGADIQELKRGFPVLFLAFRERLICLLQCVSYTELEKHGSVEVSQPDNRIYFDLSPFEVGELIQFSNIN